MKKIVRLHLVRHGQTMFNIEQKVQGWSDSFLTEKGLMEAKTLGQRWATNNKKFDVIYSSDSGRTLQTARMILEAAELELNIKPEPRLREFNFGIYEGGSDLQMQDEVLTHLDKTFEEIKDISEFLGAVSVLNEKKKAVIGSWPAEHPKTYSERLLEVMTEISTVSLKEQNQDILLISHGITICSIINLLFPDTNYAVNEITNTSVTVIEYDGQNYSLSYVAGDE